MDFFNIDSEVEISPAGVGRIRQGHLWVYAGNTVRESGASAKPIVRVLDGNGNIIAHAFHSPASQIRLRIFTLGPEPPTVETLRSRLHESVRRRSPDWRRPSAQRLVFGEGDLLPSIIVDRYADYLVVQTLSRASDMLKHLLAEMLAELVQPRGILERNDVKARRLEGLEEIRGALFGETPTEVEIMEDGVAFLVDIAQGQKTGFFLDQSENRIRASCYAAGRALDCFTNTGAFALHFARRCDSVLGIDISKDSLERAKQNAERNGASNVAFTEGNAFDALRELERSGEMFDLVCLDPPAFAKNRASLAGARGGYKEINLRAMKLSKPGGILVTSSCSYHLSEQDFAAILLEASRDAHRYVQVLEKRAQAVDHPALASMPETRYLKCFILRVL